MSLIDYLPYPLLKLPTTTPLSFLEKKLIQHHALIEEWFQTSWQKTPPPWHCSVDLRASGYKIAPVDTNLFPAGFNNLNPAFYPHCISALKNKIQSCHPQAKNILFIPEDHTRNTFYFQSIAVLTELLKQAGYTVYLGSLTATETQHHTLDDQQTLRIDPIARVDNTLFIKEICPDLILLNNDLSSGIPSLLQHVTQPICPHPQLGWATRLKSTHFTHYQMICEEIGTLLDLDPWLINPLFRNCGEVDFTNQTGQECIHYHVSLLLQEIKQKYRHYRIDKPPFVFVKADAGTYGMGVMVIHQSQDVKNLNRKQRAHMSKTKGNQQINKVIIQEGIYSNETWLDAQQIQRTAEPVIYMLGREVVGGFYRINENRANNENLNSPGMTFERLTYVDTSFDANSLEAVEYRAYAYSVIARLALLAAARENQNLWTNLT